MIVLCGIPSEPPLRLVHESLAELDLPVTAMDQHGWEVSQIEARVGDGLVSGMLSVLGADVALESVTAMFTRLMDESRLPDLDEEPTGSPKHRRSTRSS